jgi:hypothetical protein
MKGTVGGLKRAFNVAHLPVAAEILAGCVEALFRQRLKHATKDVMRGPLHALCDEVLVLLQLGLLHRQLQGNHLGGGKLQHEVWVAGAALPDGRGHGDHDNVDIIGIIPASIQVKDLVNHAVLNLVNKRLAAETERVGKEVDLQRAVCV